MEANRTLLAAIGVGLLAATALVLVTAWDSSARALGSTLAQERGDTHLRTEPSTSGRQDLATGSQSSDFLRLRDIRKNIGGAQDDPPEVQSLYDSINLTKYLLGDIPFSTLLSSAPHELLPLWLERLSAEKPGTISVDEAELAQALAEFSSVAAGLTFAEILSMVPGQFPALEALVLELISLGIDLPRPSADSPRAAEHFNGYAVIIAGGSSLRYLDLFYTSRPEAAASASPSVVAATIQLFGAGKDNKKYCTWLCAGQCSFCSTGWCCTTMQGRCSLISDCTCIGG